MKQFYSFPVQIEKTPVPTWCCSCKEDIKVLQPMTVYLRTDLEGTPMLPFHYCEHCAEAADILESVYEEFVLGEDNTQDLLADYYEKIDKEMSGCYDLF